MFTFNLIKFSKEYGKFIKIGLPILGSQLVMYGMTTVDYIMAGYYSSDDLAGVGLAAAIYSPVYFLTAGACLLYLQLLPNILAQKNTTNKN